MSEYSKFITASARKASDEEHRKKILRVITTYDRAVKSQKVAQFHDWHTARETAAVIKDYALDNLPELLAEFEKRISERGAKVLWARDAAEARSYIHEIMVRHQARKVVKSKSMTTEELGLNEFLEKQGVTVWETDLGELIVQLAGQKPYHIVTPAMHMSKRDVSELFNRTLGSPLSDSAEELTDVARRHLREAYVTADIGITGANFLVADDGAVVMIENEGNGRLSMACPPVHVVIAGIEKVIPKLEQLELFLPLLATSGTGQQVSAYVSIARGPRAAKEPDGPSEMYVILLDNGRSGIYARPEYREALRCIRCGACLNACPVYKTIGGHSYHTPYMGPIGSVITPHLRGLGGWHHLSAASSLCGACTEVCPVTIPLHHMLLRNRKEVWAGKKGGLFWRAALKVWAFLVEKRERLDLVRPLMRWGSSVAASLTPRGWEKPPVLSKRSFSQIWEEHEQQRRDN